MSAAIDALKQVLGTALNSVEVFDYGFAGDFEKLWKFEGLSDRILIVWGRTVPDGALWPIDASACLSPFDWAAAYARRHCCPETKEQGTEMAAVRHWPQVMILDATPEAHLTVPTLSHYRTLRADQLPWLTVPESPGLKDVCEWLKSTPIAVDQITQASLNRFLREIRLNLTEVRSTAGYDRHSISNIVAPMVLLGRSVTQSRHSDSLEKLMKAAGMVCAGRKGNSIAALENLNIILIDDQAEHGWSDWVRSRINPASCRVVTSSSPSKFVNMLKELPESDFRFRIGKAIFGSAGAGSEVRFPVLLLDLRLFSGNAEGERLFFKDTLLKLIRSKYLSSTNRSAPLPWSGFDPSPESAFSKAAAKLEPDERYEQESPEHLEMLTWLPRMLALADMALPIVIFSSTGRRSIVEKFKDFGNIITCFEKPRLFGEDSATIREATENAFADALEQAKDIARAGHRIQTVLDLKLDDLEATKQAFMKVKRVEIFHDECMSPNSDQFRVAAFAVGFPERNKANATDRFIGRNGPRFFGANALAKVTGKREGEEQWNSEIAAPLAMALNQGGSGAGQVLPFVIVSGESFPPEAKSGDPFSLVDPTGMDNVNQELLRLLLEVMLCDTLAWIVPQNLDSCHVFGATRMRAIKWGTQEPVKAEIAQELRGRWNIVVQERQVHTEQSQNGDWWVKWPSLRPDSFFGLLNELFAARANSVNARALGGRITSAYGTTLPKETDTDARPGYSYLHSIADIVARLVDVDQENRVTWNCLEENSDLPLKVRGVAGLRTRMVRIINCHRSLDEGDLADGFGYGLMIDHLHDLAGNVVVHRLRQHALRLDGNDLLKIVRYVKTGGPAWKHSVRLKDTMGGKPRGNTAKSASAASRSISPNQAHSITKTKEATTQLVQSKPKGAPRKQVFLEDTICINGLPRDSEEAAIKTALLAAGIKGEITRTQSSKAGRVALVKVGAAQAEGLLVQYTDGIRLLENDCKMTQAFAMVSEAEDAESSG